MADEYSELKYQKVKLAAAFADFALSAPRPYGPIYALQHRAAELNRRYEQFLYTYPDCSGDLTDGLLFALNKVNNLVDELKLLKEFLADILKDLEGIRDDFDSGDPVRIDAGFRRLLIAEDAANTLANGIGKFQGRIVTADRALKLAEDEFDALEQNGCDGGPISGGPGDEVYPPWPGPGPGDEPLPDPPSQPESGEI